jgi:cyclopropane fatty-acyl-phospholipid synthase-like methyltransferase
VEWGRLVNLEEYSDIFAERGAAYHGAMRRQPDARNAEFDALFLHHLVKSGESLLDIPAGGGYLAKRLPKGVAISELELTKGFTPHLRVVPTYGDWDIGKFDHVVCLAALHHIQEQDRFIAQLAQHTKSGGIIHVADTDLKQSIPTFLDGFVGRFNVTGHHGRYIGEHSFTNIPGTRLLSSEIRECAWRFPNEEQALDFAADLFGLVNYPRAEFRDAVKQLVGMREENGAVLLDWKLRYIDLKLL